MRGMLWATQSAFLKRIPKHAAEACSRLNLSPLLLLQGLHALLVDMLAEGKAAAGLRLQCAAAVLDLWPGALSEATRAATDAGKAAGKPQLLPGLLLECLQACLFELCQSFAPGGSGTEAGTSERLAAEIVQARCSSLWQVLLEQGGARESLSGRPTDRVAAQIAQVVRQLRQGGALLHLTGQNASDWATLQFTLHLLGAHRGWKWLHDEVRLWGGAVLFACWLRLSDDTHCCTVRLPAELDCWALLCQCLMLSCGDLCCSAFNTASQWPAFMACCCCAGLPGPADSHFRTPCAAGRGSP